MTCLPILLSMSKLTTLIQKTLGRKTGSAQEAKERLKTLQTQATPSKTVQETKKAA